MPLQFQPMAFMTPVITALVRLASGTRTETQLQKGATQDERRPGLLAQPVLRLNPAFLP
jgi:hypothetical protein